MRMPSTSAPVSREHLQAQLKSVLPPESAEYIKKLNHLRFARSAGSDQRFFTPRGLIALLTAAVEHRGDLEGDDRTLMMAEGIAADAFELPEHYTYLKVPAEGQIGLLPINELPHWLPVTLRAEEEPNTRIGFRRARPRNPESHLLFTIDADFQRAANYATIIIAPNWHAPASCERAILDAFLGPPVPSKLQSVSVENPVVAEHGWEHGSELQVQQLRAIFPDRPLWLSCRNRNLPGT